MPFKSLNVCFMLCFLCCGIDAQEKKVSQLIDDLNDASFSVRQAAAEGLSQGDETVVTPLLQAIVSKTQARETRRRCAQILLKLASRKDQKIDAALKQQLPKYQAEKFQHASLELKQLRFKILGEVNISEKQAIGLLREHGCSITPSRRVKGITIDAKNFKGTKQDFKNIVAIKQPIRLKINIRKRHELFDILPKCNLAAIQLRDGYSQVVKNDQLKHQVSAAMQQICRCQNLTELSLDFAVIDARALNGIEKLTNLVQITLPRTATDETLSRLAKHKKLSHINFINCQNISGAGFKDFAENKLIKSLDFHSTGLKTENLKYLNKFPNLSRLTLHQNCYNEDVQIISKLPALKQLDLDNTLVTNEVVDSLAKMKNLRYLDIGESPLTNQIIKKINALETLERFRFRRTFITEQGSKELRFDNEYNSQTFFVPDSARQLKLVHELVDRGVPIKPNLEAGIVDLYFQGKNKIDLSKLEQLKVKNVYLNKIPTPENLLDILKLNDTARICVINPDIPNEIVDKLRNRFEKFTDARAR